MREVSGTDTSRFSGSLQAERPIPASGETSPCGGASAT